jgi:hypothetical protein
MSPPVDINENATRAKESDFEKLQRRTSFKDKLHPVVCKRRFLLTATNRIPPFSEGFRETVSYFLLRVGSSIHYAVSLLELVPPTTQCIVPELPLYTKYREGHNCPPLLTSFVNSRLPTSEKETRCFAALEGEPVFFLTGRIFGTGEEASIK